MKCIPEPAESPALECPSSVITGDAAATYGAKTTCPGAGGAYGRGLGRGRGGEGLRTARLGRRGDPRSLSRAPQVTSADFRCTSLVLLPSSVNSIKRFQKR
ncbi:hypothetical protein GE061_016573 [Apolygus lucorum]|uniref:Uncharacterized protein n=1 Tax=Apolygus lucorum TaxID=248454 RepID=A0A8S9XGM2_APOLU|nr:hypothetical protein GE061_016573 [Apolygus lucorum]